MSLRNISRATLIAALLFQITPLLHPQNSTMVPDPIAYTALFHVVYEAPPPHWDKDTSLGWLRSRGASTKQAELIIFAATRYMRKHAEVESDLDRLNRETSKSIAPPVQARRTAIELRRRRELSLIADQLQKDLGSDGVLQLRAILDNVKRDVRMK